jgi:hypothetical protein
MGTRDSGTGPLISVGATAETSGVADEFGGGDFLNGAGRGEIFPKGVTEVVVVFFFEGVDAAIEGEEAEFCGIGGGFSFALTPKGIRGLSGDLGPVEALALARFVLICAPVAKRLVTDAGRSIQQMLAGLAHTEIEKLRANDKVQRISSFSLAVRRQAW